MSTITTRSGKGSPLTNAEVDDNFVNLNSDKLESSSYTAADVLSKLSSVDGDGSGLDADLLDGQHGSHYLNTTTTFGGDVSGTYDALVIADDSHDHIIGNIDGLQAALDSKQDTLVSGTTIKTVNSQSVLGSGNIQIDGGVTSFNTRTGAVSLTSTDVTDALTFTPISSSDNAATATALQTSRTIGGVSFDGTANIDLPGVNTAGNQNTTGNAATATTLQTARTINGVSFDGSANITVADSTKLPLTGGTLDNGVNTTLTLLSDDTGASTLNLYGNSQGTGRVFVGQSTAFGGGIEYNGDGSPSTTGAGADYITLWRRSSSVDSWTARNSQSNNDWEFRGSVTAPVFYGGAAGYFTGGTLAIGTTAATADLDIYEQYSPGLKVRGQYANILVGAYYGNATIRDTADTNQPGINFTASAVVPAGGTSSLNPSDNLLDLGNATYRWDDIYATNTVIQTSDRNYKQDIEELSEAEKRVALVAKSLMRKYRWKDAVEKKGDDARIHYGIIAQDLKAAFENEGLDAHRYAMFTWNEWWEGDRVIPAVEAQEAVYETQIDEEGIERQVCVSEAIKAHEEVSYPDVFYTEAEAPANAIRKERMGIRYNELLSFIIAALPGS